MLSDIAAIFFESFRVVDEHFGQVVNSAEAVGFDDLAVIMLVASQNFT